MSDINDFGLLIVDVQGKLARIVHNSELMIANTRKLIGACQALTIPVIVLEQNSQGLGSTVPELSELLGDAEPIEKQHFDGMRETRVSNAIAKTGKQHWIVAGIEAHICVYQTVNGLIASGYSVELAADCISSRESSNIELAINNLTQIGVSITSVEMVVYQLMKTAEHPAFRQVLRIVK